MRCAGETGAGAKKEPSQWLAGRSPRIACLLIAALFLTGAVLASTPPVIERHVLGSGGGLAEVGAHSLQATLGQAVSGAGGLDPYGLCAGFWCNAAAAEPPQYGIYLPLVMRTG